MSTATLPPTTAAAAADSLLEVPGSPSSPSPTRPKFNSQLTSDRLREGSGLYLPPLFRTSSNLRKGRTSVFKEMGLDDHACCVAPASAADRDDAACARD